MVPSGLLSSRASATGHKQLATAGPSISYLATHSYGARRIPRACHTVVVARAGPANPSSGGGSPSEHSKPWWGFLSGEGLERRPRFRSMASLFTGASVSLAGMQVRTIGARPRLYVQQASSVTSAACIAGLAEPLRG